MKPRSKFLDDGAVVSPSLRCRGIMGLPRAARLAFCLFGAWGCLQTEQTPSNQASAPQTTARTKSFEYPDALHATTQLASTVDWGIDSDVLQIQDSLELDISFHGFPDDTQWSAYLNQTENSVEGGQLISGERVIAEKRLLWDASGLAAGTYYIFIVAQNLSETTVHYSPFHLERFTAESANRSPFATLIEPGAQQFFINGAEVEVRFRAIDLDGDEVTYELHYRCTGNTDWMMGASDFTPETLDNSADLLFRWAIPPDVPQSSRCKIRVFVSDGLAQSAGELNGVIGIAPQQITYAMIQPMLVEKCGACHTGDTPEKNLRVDSYDDIILEAEMKEFKGVRNRIDRMIERVNLPASDARKMPLGGSLSQEQIELLELFRYGGRAP